MQYLSHALERVTVIFRPRTPGKHSRAYVAPSVMPTVVYDQPTPDVRSARVMAAQVRRAAAPVPPAVEDMGALVRPYLFTPEERRQVHLSARLERMRWQ
jgi:hypothetical protein